MLYDIAISARGREAYELRHDQRKQWREIAKALNYPTADAARIAANRAHIAEQHELTAARWAIRKTRYALAAR